MVNIQGFESPNERQTRLMIQFDKKFWRLKGVKQYNPISKKSLLKAKVIRRKMKRNKTRKASLTLTKELGREFRTTLEVNKAIASIKFLFCEVQA